jgi:hypothetical protein
MARALFVSQNSFYDISPLYDNVEVKDIKSHLVSAQDIEIQNLLGYKLYNELQNGIISVTLTDNQKELLELIKPCLVWYAYSTSLPFLLIKSTNKSLVTKNSDNSQPVSMSDMIYLKNEARDRAEFYATLVKDYLNNPDTISQNKFPSYQNQDPNNIEANKDSQFVNYSWFIPKNN